MRAKQRKNLPTSYSRGKNQMKNENPMKEFSRHLTVQEQNKMKNEGQMKKLSRHLTVQKRNKMKNEG